MNEVKANCTNRIERVVMLLCEWVHPDINSLDDFNDFEVGKTYKLVSKKKIRHTKKYKALLKSEFGEIRVHSNMINDFDELIENYKFKLAI